MTHLVLAVLPVLPGFLWLAWMYRQDRYEPEPRHWVLLSFAFGALMMWPAGWASAWLADLAGVPRVPIAQLVAGGDTAALLVALVVVTGPVEELAKWLVVRLLCYPSREFDEPLDGIIYGTATALGFASIENVWYLHQAHGSRQYALTYVLRGLTSVPMHGLCGALFGYGLGNAKVRRGSSLPWLALAAIAHGLFDVAASVSVLAGIVALVPMGGVVHLLVQAHRARSPFRPGEAAALRRALVAEESQGGTAVGLALRCATCSAVWRAPRSACERCGSSLDAAPSLCGRCGTRLDAVAEHDACGTCGGRLR